MKGVFWELTVFLIGMGIVAQSQPEPERWIWNAIAFGGVLLAIVAVVVVSRGSAIRGRYR